MSEQTRDPQTKSVGAVKQGTLAAAVVAVVMAFFPDVAAPKALAALGCLQIVTGLIGSAARDWAHDTGTPAKEVGLLAWLAMRLG